MKVLAGPMEKYLIDSWITLPMEDREYCYTLQKFYLFTLTPIMPYNFALREYLKSQL